MSQQFQYLGLKFEWRVMELQMKKTWQTSHSISQSRSNFLVTITKQQNTGFGEAGLPPKKPGCYLADVNDCFKLMEVLRDTLAQGKFENNPEILNVQDYFQNFRNDSQKQIFIKILSALHSITEPTYRAGISACQFALFDLWAKSLGKSLFQCIYGQNLKLEFKSFCSVSIGQNQIEEAKETAKLTPFIKLKFKDDFDIIKKNITYLISQNVGQLIVMDANASWSASTTKKVIQFIAENGFQKKIHCLEQPFQVYPSEEWKQVYKLARQKGVSIMSDESFTNGDDIDKVKQISNGVNIKIQKTGGLIEALKSAIRAKDAKMEIWLGIMISSWLGCTQTYMLAPFAHYGDLDGGLLVHSPFEGGFKSLSNGVLEPIEGKGLAIKEINKN